MQLNKNKNFTRVRTKIKNQKNKKKNPKTKQIKGQLLKFEGLDAKIEVHSRHTLTRMDELLRHFKHLHESHRLAAHHPKVRPSFTR
jgi:hypothetical protein